MLHITNGDGAASRLRDAGFPGEVVPWRDVLHEGPVPEGLTPAELRGVRARFLSSMGWGSVAGIEEEMAQRDAAIAAAERHEEVVLWFEHDLYDQLQLLQVLDALGPVPPTRLTLVCRAEYLGSVTATRALELHAARADVTPAMLNLASLAWSAFRAPDPAPLESVLMADTAALPFLAGSLRRHLEELPSVLNGLSRSEAQILDVVTQGRRRLAEVFVAAHHERESPVFLGDTVFLTYLARLSDIDRPLVTFDDGERIALPVSREALERRAAVTDTGEAVLAGWEDAVRLNGVDRWLGGIHLEGRAVPFRWDTAAGAVRRL